VNKDAVMFKDKCILVGIGGGIAVYRVAELVRLLEKQGARVRCVMTAAACEFVAPMTFEALTGETVHTELFDLTAEREMGHIRLARWADVLLIAPATADLLARFSHGICDNLLSTLFQAREGPVLMAPAMNTSMWESPATQRNLAELRKRGVYFTGPADGALACGEEGMGRMSEPVAVMEALYPLTLSQRLSGQRWLINTGPTWEAWDEVRILTSRASGKLGVLLAGAASARGAHVTLVAGPGTPPSPSRVRRFDVCSARDMLSACKEEAAGADAFVATAAVSDYRFSKPVKGKLKREGRQQLTVALTANEDIVAHISALPERPRRVVAFAAECQHHADSARTKLRAKGADAIFANDIRNMGSDTAAGWWLTCDQDTVIPRMTKPQLAELLIEKIMEMEK